MRKLMLSCLGIMVILAVSVVTPAVTFGEPRTPRATESTEIVTPEAAPAPLPREQTDVGPAWREDVLLAGSDADEVNPRMACVPLFNPDEGDLYTVVEHADDNYIHIFKSTDGGETWHFWFWVGSVDYNVASPDIAIGVGNEDWIFVVYCYRNQIQVIRINFDATYWDFHNVDSSSYGVKYPRITTDCVDIFGPNFNVYVTYDLATSKGFWNLFFARSTDFGASYVDQTFLWRYSFGRPARPDIACGAIGAEWYLIFVSFENLDSEGDSNVYVMRNTRFGDPDYWEEAVQLTTSTDAEYDSAVTAVHFGFTVVVAYTRRRVRPDLDVWYAYSTDRGVTWTTDRWLSSGSYVDDKSPDLDVSIGWGKIHVVYWSNSHVVYKSTGDETPELLPVVTEEGINEGNTASSTYSWMTVATNPTKTLPNELEACVAWTDSRNPTNDVYFDANYLAVFQYHFRLHPYGNVIHLNINPGRWLNGYMTGGPIDWNPVLGRYEGDRFYMAIDIYPDREPRYVDTLFLVGTVSTRTGQFINTVDGMSYKGPYDVNLVPVTAESEELEGPDITEVLSSEEPGPGGWYTFQINPYSDVVHLNTNPGGWLNGYDETHFLEPSVLGFTEAGRFYFCIDLITSPRTLAFIAGTISTRAGEMIRTIYGTAIDLGPEYVWLTPA